MTRKFAAMQPKWTTISAILIVVFTPMVANSTWDIMTPGNYDVYDKYSNITTEGSGETNVGYRIRMMQNGAIQRE